MHLHRQILSEKDPANSSGYPGPYLLAKSLALAIELPDLSCYKPKSCSCARIINAQQDSSCSVYPIDTLQ